MTTNLFTELEALLASDSQYAGEDGNLLKNKIVEAALQLKPEFIKLLLSNEKLKNNFFTEVEGILIFDKVKFQKFVSNKRFLPDSYTSFKNKIGLVGDEGDFLAESKEVVLSWPYKDCVLEGGQTKEDAKRNEVFWNEILAPDEINRLTEPKTLTNFVKYDSEGEHNVESISKNDNLIIKGNNLLALHSLKEKYAGQVKLIYIDPPYNTGNDSFQYNDSFQHSTWLTFMKNRLEIAFILLKDNGIIFIQCDDNEQAYLKVLCDSIFSPESFVDTFVWKNTDNAPTLSKKSRKNIEFIHCYEKKQNKSLSYHGRESDNSDAPLLNSGNPIKNLTFPPNSIHFNIPDGIYKKGIYESLQLLTDIEVLNSTNNNSVTLSGRFKWGQNTVYDEISNKTYFIIKTDKMSIRYQREDASIIAPDKFIDGLYLSKAIGISTNEDSKKEIDNLKLPFPSFPKPETLIAFLVKAVTTEGDLVMDFFLGSGTTAAVAHKMNRKYIGIDQMNYIKEVAVKRLCKVIKGENGGVSSTVNWKGGGSFVYCELAKSNQNFVDQIQTATTKNELQTIWQSMQETGFLSWKVNPKEINDKISDFTDLDLDDMKRFLIEVLDKNLLYVPYSEIDNEEFGISEEDKRLNKIFYAKKV
ncbi:adenine-specific DNA-methyltransferase [Bacteroides luti]|uniref:site-specific DNA-methyltransferase (adenine-specific) n=1 Tax=Bacteroides luti TaxID=1297750 RepID=A0A1M5ATF3_9BACE|nr:site-specific DNA-methyltransferase [Bacteroides luti]SHF33377.1 adenine-specific DNA-methyltransferase [Bacteroides luti]